MNEHNGGIPTEGMVRGGRVIVRRISSQEGQNMYLFTAENIVA